MYRWLTHQKDLTSSLQGRGFGMLDMLVALTVSLSLITFGTRYATKQADDLINQTTAQQLSQLATAVNHYAHDNFARLQEETQNDHTVVWDSQKIEQMLKDGGYLSTTLPMHNPYQQSYQLVIQQKKSAQQPKQPLLQFLLLTQAGQTICESSLRQIARWVGPSSGYISHLNPKQVTGNLQSWELSQVNGMAIPSAGHLASLDYLHANDVLNASSLLFRKKIDGHPEYNRMDTDLQMAANIELEDGTEIWFKQGSEHPTIIESGRLMLQQNSKSTQLSPGQVEVNTPEDAYSILTNAHIKAAGNIEAGHNMTAGQNLYAKKLEMKNEKTCSTEITPAKIYLVSQEDREKSYVTNNHLKFKNREQYSIHVNAYSMKNGQYPNSSLGSLRVTNTKGMFSELDSRYLKIPLIEIYDPYNEKWETLAGKLDICWTTYPEGPNGREGALFLMGPRGTNKRGLLICAGGEPKLLDHWG